ncbi:MAG: SRPBCC family protein [Bauldia sp.]
MPDASASIDIDAPPDLVWRIVADTELHPTIDATTSRILGFPDEGARLKVYSTLSPDHPLTVRVITYAPPRRMVWRNSRWFGLVRGVRSFAVDPLDGPRSRFTLSESWSGPLLRLVSGSIADRQDAFRGLCAGLKALAEAAVAPPSRGGR